MAEKTTQQIIENASSMMQRVILKNHRRPAKEVIEHLGKDDIKVLRSLLKEKEVDENIQQDKIIAVLSERDPSVETAKLLKSILDDQQRKPLLRVVAATELARMPVEIAEAALLKHVDDPNIAVSHRALMSLAKLGGEKSLKQLAKIRYPENSLLRRQWIFSQRLIRHRLGIVKDLDVSERGSSWAPASEQDVAVLPVEAIDVKYLAPSLAELQGQIRDVQLAENRGLSISSDGLTTFVFLNTKLTSEGGRQELNNKPMLAAVIAMWDERLNKPVMDQVALVSPFGQKLLLQGFRLDGVQVFEGYATVDDADLKFTVTSTDHPGQCRFRAKGFLRAEGLVVQAESMARLKPRATRDAIEAVV